MSIGFGPRFILGDLPNIVGLYDSAGQSGYPRKVVNLEQTMDVTNDEDVRTTQWDQILALGPMYPVTLDDLSFDHNLGIGGFCSLPSL